MITFLSKEKLSYALSKLYSKIKNNFAAKSHTHTGYQITQDSTHRFVTDTEKTTWNGKASTSVATTSANGLMSSSDKTKLNGIATGANKYTLPTATDSTLGGVKIGSNITVSSGAISIDKENVTDALGYTPPTTNTTYGVVSTTANGLCPKRGGSTTKFLRDDGTWAVPPNTTYGVATQSTNGLLSAADKKLLDELVAWKKSVEAGSTGVMIEK